MLDCMAAALSMASCITSLWWQTLLSISMSIGIVSSESCSKYGWKTKSDLSKTNWKVVSLPLIDTIGKIWVS